MKNALIFSLFLIIIFFTQSTPAGEVVRIALSDESPPTSYVVNGKEKGIFKDLLDLIFKDLPEYTPIFKAIPWGRAQSQVHHGQMDLFLTFPSESRKAYADFINEPVYVWDYGYLIYNFKNPNKTIIENAKKFEDLKNLIFISQKSVEWEKENVPSYIKRNFAIRIPTMMHLLFKRSSGDFLIMSPDQALYYSVLLGYENQLGIKKVAFIPNSKVMFHIGIRKTYHKKVELLNAIESVIKRPSFIKKKNDLIKKYGYDNL